MSPLSGLSHSSTKSSRLVIVGEEAAVRYDAQGGSDIIVGEEAAVRYAVKHAQEEETALLAGVAAVLNFGSFREEEPPQSPVIEPLPERPYRNQKNGICYQFFVPPHAQY